LLCCWHAPLHDVCREWLSIAYRRQLCQYITGGHVLRRCCLRLLHLLAQLLLQQEGKLDRHIQHVQLLLQATPWRDLVSSESL
jgi:hypothetical protein